jgi:chlorobactene glucosyltransferase
LRLFRGWVRIPSAAGGTEVPSLSIVVPARDEERNIERCVRSLMHQRGVACEVIVIDDRSTDRTRAILQTLQGEFPRLTVVDGAPLPAGWVGKPWACAQGAACANGAWLLFTDADSVHAPGASLATLAFARANGADALSMMTGQEMGTLAERAILPAILSMIVFATGPLAEINDPSRPDRALANGQYLLVERTAYDALGGHTAVHDAIVEDIEFARRLKADGRYRLVIADGTPHVQVRMYHSFREIWDGFTKNMYLGARGDLRAIAAGMIFCLTLSAAPLVLAAAALRARRWGDAAEVVAVPIAVVAMAWRVAPYVSMPRRLAIYAPFGIFMFAAIAGNSTLRALSGRGFEWRGRRYDAHPPR